RASITPARGIASTAQSSPSGRCAGEGRQDRPLISLRLALTRCTSPSKPKRSRLASTAAPSEPGVAEAPMTASRRGRSSLATAAARSRPGSVIAAISAETGPETLLVQELRQALRAALFDIEQTRGGLLG